MVLSAAKLLAGVTILRVRSSEVIRAALRLLEAQEMEFPTKQQTLRAALIAGETSGDSDLRIDDIIAGAKQNRPVKRAGV